MRSISLLFLSFTSTVQAHAPLRGVGPTEQVHYEGREVFKCLNDGQSLPFARVNDNVCDCLDGSDEPGVISQHVVQLDACFHATRSSCILHPVNDHESVSSSFDSLLSLEKSTEDVVPIALPCRTAHQHRLCRDVCLLQRNFLLQKSRSQVQDVSCLALQHSIFANRRGVISQFQLLSYMQDIFNVRR
jgi:hypothetical protein